MDKSSELIGITPFMCPRVVPGWFAWNCNVSCFVIKGKNIDGTIGSLLLDLLEGSGMFSKQEIDEIGYLNGLFVLARSIGLIG